MITRVDFNQEMQGVVRHLLQAAAREGDARRHLAAVQIDPTPRPYIVRESAERGLEAAAGVTDAAIMEFTDRLYDAIYGPRAESMLEAARLGATG